MRRPERVVDVDVGEAGERLGELGIVGLLPGVEAQVLEEQQVARAQLVDGVLDARAERVAGHPHRAAKELAEPIGDRLEPKRVVDLAVRTPEVAGQDHDRALLEEVDQGRQAGPDPGVIGDPPVVERDVEVGAQEDALAADVDVADGLEASIGARHSRSPMKAARSATRQV